MVKRIPLPLDAIKVGEDRLAPSGSQAQLAFVEGVDSIIVFIHGWGGNPVSTWLDFPTLLANDSRANKADFAFYGYSSRWTQSTIHANQFLFFLNSVMSGALEKELESEQFFRPPFEYKSLILVGHSLGGVVIRQALLYAKQSSAPWLKRVRVVLFAPAHCGARIAKSVSEMTETLPSLAKLRPYLEFLVPARDELDPAPSAFLKALREKTEAYSKEAGMPRSPFAAECVFGDSEQIVIADHFDCDRRQTPDWADQGHMSICKPSTKWRRPLELILGQPK